MKILQEAVLGDSVLEYLGSSTLLAAALGLYYKHQCHVQGCPRLSWHPHPSHGHPVCKRHHPHHESGGGSSVTPGGIS